VTNEEHEGVSIPPDPRVMDIYKLSVEMADRISARRAVANAFFLTVNTTLAAVIGLHKPEDGSALLPVAVCVAGIAVSVCWWYLLRNYRKLNEAKFVVINKIEADYLPLTPFLDEWAILSNEGNSKGKMARVRARLRQLGNVERVVPVIFGLLYLMLLVGRMPLCPTT
jgi:hypothetical protein maviaA2_03527